jgi:ABC-2 type transport system permease protein
VRSNPHGFFIGGKFMLLNKYIKTAIITMRTKTNGGLIYMLPDVLGSLMYLVPLMFLWRVLAGQGVETGMTLSQMLSYAYMNALLGQMLVVQTFVSRWNYEGQLISLFARPVPVFGQIISQTVGGWLPLLIFYSLPLLLISPLIGITIIPATPWFFPSLLLCVSLGFAIDFIFACVTIRLRGMAWLSYSIQIAVVSLFSGTVIPFKLMPFGLTRFFEYQPFGSLGGAPLSLFVGITEPLRIIPVQIFWNIVLWIVAVIWFRQSKERQVSYGG